MKNLIPSQKIIITILRIAIGWHFIYEGLTKLLAVNWTSAGYLANSTGFLSGFYQWMAGNSSVLQVIDILNVYGLLFIGLGLFLGVFIRYAAFAGVLLLSLYYFAYPPFGYASFFSPEGSLFIINKVLIEALALLFIALYKEKGYSIDSLIHLYRSAEPDNSRGSAEYQPSRREALKNLASLPVLGVMGFGAFSHQKKYDADVFSGATLQAEHTGLSELKGKLPKGRLGKHEMSRLIMGGNLIGGWAHGRDLIYTPALFKAYNTEKKIYETLMLAEQAGIDTINIGFPSNPVLAKYKKTFGSKLKVISQVGHDRRGDNHFDGINQAIDHGVDIVQVIGNSCDRLTMDENVELVGKMIDHIRSQGYTAGLGAHAIQSFMTCKEAGIIPDYYMVTMHHDNYWSAHPYENRETFEVMSRYNKDHGKFHDNMWCQFPEKAIEFVNNTELPVVGFKVLAAGAIRPKDGFNWAFKNGADFICVGMFDFQVVDDVNICIDTLNDLEDRKRKWFA